MIKKEFKCEMQSKIQSLTPVSAKYQVDYNKVNQIRFLYDYGNFTNDAPYSDVRLKNLSNVKVHMDNSNHLKKEVSQKGNFLEDDYLNTGYLLHKETVTQIRPTPLNSLNKVNSLNVLRNNFTPCSEGKICKEENNLSIKKVKSNHCRIQKRIEINISSIKINNDISELKFIPPEDNLDNDIISPVSITDIKEAPVKSIVSVEEVEEDNYEKFLREFGKICHFPSSNKDKMGLIKKFVPCYKKIKNERYRFNSFLSKIGSKLRESLPDLKIIFEFEEIRHKHKNLFCLISKMISRFAYSLIKNDIDEISDQTILKTHPNVKERFNHLVNKVRDYLHSYGEMHKFLASEQEIPKTLLKFITKYKLKQYFSVDIHKKISRKFSEILQRNNILYNEITLGDIKIPRSTQFKDTQIHNLGNFNQDQVEFLRQELQGSVRGFIDRTNLKESNQMPIDMLSNDLKELEVHAEQVTLGNNNEHGVLLPLKSKRYLVKQFDSKDFPDD